MKKFLILLAVGLALFILLATDTHRTAIAAIWPALEAFADYQGK
jgi:hypothetical protein